VTGILGAGLATPLGLGRAATLAAWDGDAIAIAPHPASDALPSVAQVPGFRPRKQLPDRKAVKLMSREAQLLVYAAVEACGTDVAERLGVPPEQIGAFAAAGYEVTPLDEVVDMFDASRDPDAPARLSLPRLFAEGRHAYNPLSPLKTLPNMALFHAALSLGLRGPHLAIGSSPAAGLAALSGAVDAIGDGTCSHALVGGTDAQTELFRIHYLHEAGVDAAPGEGAAALLLAADAPVRVAAVGLAQEPPAGPEVRGDYGEGASAALRGALYRRLLDEAGLDRVDLVHGDFWGMPTGAHPGGANVRDAAERSALATLPGVVDTRIVATRPRLGHLGAAHGLVDVVLAAGAIEAGRASSALVTAGGSAGDLGAVVLVGASS